MNEDVNRKWVSGPRFEFYRITSLGNEVAEAQWRRERRLTRISAAALVLAVLGQVALVWSVVT